MDSFYEYDGQYLYAVRRSSTTQVAGQVSVDRNSAIVNGTLTAFTSQLNTSDKIVIRGQTYKVVEISSDTRLVVQPPYRGITATGVKMTKTIDTKTKTIRLEFRSSRRYRIYWIYFEHQ